MSFFEPTMTGHQIGLVHVLQGQPGYVLHGTDLAVAMRMKRLGWLVELGEADGTDQFALTAKGEDAFCKTIAKGGSISLGNRMLRIRFTRSVNLELQKGIKNDAPETVESWRYPEEHELWVSQILLDSEAEGLAKYTLFLLDADNKGKYPDRLVHVPQDAFIVLESKRTIS